MVPYFHLAPTVWTGRTGKQWKALGQPYQVLGLYLQSSPAANVYGLYYVSKAQIVEETGLSLQAIGKILPQFAEMEYAFYDQDGQWCWVINMTARQLLTNWRPLISTDNRIKSINAWYAGLPDNVFLGPYFDKYHGLVHLAARRSSLQRPTPAANPGAAPSPLEEPSLFPATTVPPPLSQDDLFETWWREYPPHKRKAKKAARSEWAKIRPAPNAAFVSRMIAVLQAQRKLYDWIKDGGRYVPDPERYIKKGRYLDEVADVTMPVISEAEAQTAGTLQRWEPPRD